MACIPPESRRLCFCCSSLSQGSSFSFVWTYPWSIAARCCPHRSSTFKRISLFSPTLVSPIKSSRSTSPKRHFASRRSALPSIARDWLAGLPRLSLACVLVLMTNVKRVQGDFGRGTMLITLSHDDHASYTCMSQPAGQPTVPRERKLLLCDENLRDGRARWTLWLNSCDLHDQAGKSREKQDCQCS